MKEPWGYGERDKAKGEFYFLSPKCAIMGRGELSFSTLHSVCDTFFIDGNGPYGLNPRERLRVQIEGGEIVSFVREYQDAPMGPRDYFD